MLKTVLIKSFYEVNYTPFKLPLITVYEKPDDFPEHFVARLFDVEVPTPYAVVGHSLQEIREAIPPRFFFLGRQPEDDRNIREVWV